MNLRSDTLDTADQARLAGRAGEGGLRSHLHGLAEREAVELVQRARSEREVLDRDVLLEAPACIDIAAHVQVSTLAEAIYMHALVHAGFITPAPGEYYDVCPLCRDDLPRPT
ncbi:MAG TPA: hypothetical protein VF024_12185 [Solirubrobacteraceae bacterium]